MIVSRALCLPKLMLAVPLCSSSFCSSKVSGSHGQPTTLDNIQPNRERRAARRLSTSGCPAFPALVHPQQCQKNIWTWTWLGCLESILHEPNLSAGCPPSLKIMDPYVITRVRKWFKSKASRLFWISSRRLYNFCIYKLIFFTNPVGWTTNSLFQNQKNKKKFRVFFPERRFFRSCWRVSYHAYQ